MSEFDRTPAPPEALKPGRYFAANYAGEHVAGTEFVIGAMFVSWGVGALDVINGLLVGNLLAVLTWGAVCGPIATNTRLTLYAYLEKIAGPGFMKIYSVVNGLLFCVLAGAMITVSASAVRVLFNIEPQVNWFPTDVGFVAIVLVVGAVVTWAAMGGFGFVAKFSEVSAPWLVSVFFIGAVALAPVIVQSSDAIDRLDGFSSFLTLASSDIWLDRGGDIGFWHVVALAWGANLAFHGALGDMTILRFARHGAAGWYSAIGMFIGHFLAWLAAGVMGAGAALLLKTDLSKLDPGAVAVQALGPMGILAVILAGWTTSNPTIYRAGLAFQTLNPRWSRERVTLVVGVTTTMIAAFPFVFTRLLDFLGVMALLMAPTGGIIFAEHYLLRRLGMVRYWRAIRGDAFNLAAVLTWAFALGAAAILYFQFNVHVLFLFVPAWFAALACYLALAATLGARKADAEEAQRREAAEESRRRAEAEYLADLRNQRAKGPTLLFMLCFALASVGLIGGLGLGGYAYATGDLDGYRSGLIASTAVYFAGAIGLLFASPAGEAKGSGVRE